MYKDKKLALVTGSTLGIGYAIAEALVNDNADVIINGRNEARVQEAVDKINSGKTSDAQAIAGVADLSTAEGVESLTGRFPEVDVLVNNLGIFEPKPFAEITDADWLKFFEVNVLSGVRLSRHYLPQMLDKNWGRIIFISSESGIMTPKEMIHYGMTKSAQLAVSRGLAEMTAGTAVTVNSVLPGPTASEGVQTFVDQLAKAGNKTNAEMEDEFFRTMRPTSLIKRFAKPEEIAAVVAFVCSPEAAVINGSSVRAEGGLVQSII